MKRASRSERVGGAERGKGGPASDAVGGFAGAKPPEFLFRRLRSLVRVAHPASLDRVAMKRASRSERVGGAERGRGVTRAGAGGTRSRITRATRPGGEKPEAASHHRTGRSPKRVHPDDGTLAGEHQSAVRNIIETRGHFPNEEAMTLIWLALRQSPRTQESSHSRVPTLILYQARRSLLVPSKAKPPRTNRGEAPSYQARRSLLVPSKAKPPRTNRGEAPSYQARRSLLVPSSRRSLLVPS